ncbi:MAG: hypothetical protein DRN04_09875 [Thermoprotei archaeon]|nr:MAG: hypothetical protein DRN04_09875 [Thermoprotei archaeon]
MPDTFTHATLGLVAGVLVSRNPLTWIIAVLLSEIPDIDAFTLKHRAISHSIIVLFPAAILLSIVLENIGFSTTQAVLLAVLPLLHIAIDSTTGGPPVKILWPISSKGVQLASKVDIVIEKLIVVSPYSYYKEVIRVNLVLFICILLLTLLTLLHNFPK